MNGYGGMYNLNIYGGYGPVMPAKKKEKEAEKVPTFKVQVPPQQLDKLEIVWNIALHCQNEQVVPKAIEFLIKVYYCLDADLNRIEI